MGLGEGLHTMSAPQFEQLLMELSKAQTEMSELATARTKLETQFQENKVVLEEFEKLDSGSTIYKLVGPALMRQDYAEAKMNVDKRIEFIQNEIKRVDDKMETHQKHMEETRSKLIQLRQAA